MQPSDTGDAGRTTHHNSSTTDTSAPYVLPTTSGEQQAFDSDGLQLPADPMYMNGLDNSITFDPRLAHGSLLAPQRHQPSLDQQHLP